MYKKCRYNVGFSYKKRVYATIHSFLDFWCNVCGQCERIVTRKKHIVNGVFHLILSLLLFLAVCMMTNDVDYLDLLRTRRDHNFTAGLFFAVLGGVLMFVDGMVMIVLNEAGFLRPCKGYTDIPP